MADSLHTRPLQAGDEAYLPGLEALNRPEGTAWTPEVWRWRQLHPAGNRSWVGEDEGGVRAHFATCPQRTWMAGEEQFFSQIVEAAQGPDESPLLDGVAEALVETARGLLEATSGLDGDWVTHHVVGGGDLRFQRRVLQHEVVRTPLVLRLDLSDRKPPPSPAAIEECTAFDDQARWLWDRCVGHWGASTIRDESYLSWRYLQHPNTPYTCLGLRDADGILRGLAVYATLPEGRIGHPLAGASGATGVIVDWMVPREEPEVGRALRRAAVRLALDSGARSMVTFFPEWSPWFVTFQEEDWRVHPTDLVHMARSHHPRFDMFWLRGNWWVQLGDTSLL